MLLQLIIIIIKLSSKITFIIFASSSLKHDSLSHFIDDSLVL